MLIATCPKCKREIPADAPRNLCPFCLLDTALQPSDAVLHTNNAECQRYSDREEISRGGMGRILLVRDDYLGRNVVLKQLSPEAKALFDTLEPGDVAPNSDGAGPRFINEARITGRLEHPYIVPVYDLGHDAEDIPYYTMRYVRGNTLAEKLLQCQTLDDRMAMLSNFLHVCQGIAYAHSKGVIHRDIKPANILVGEFGETVIIDWGLAKSIDQTDTDPEWPEVSDTEVLATRPGHRLGTPYYMSPEQVNSKTSCIDQRTDVFALGVVLYEILTGRPPIHGGDLETIYDRVVNEVPKRPTLLDRKIPRELETICLKALEKNPARRYQSARELAQDVERFLNGALVQAYSYSAAERLWRVYRAYKTPLQLLAASAVVLAAVVAIAFARIQDARDDALRAWTNEKAVRTVAETERYHALISLARHQIESDSVDVANATLLSVEPALRNWEWGYLFNVTQQSTARMNGFVHLRISPDEKALAAVGPRQPLAVWSLEDFQEIFSTPSEVGQLTTFEFQTSTGHLLAAGADGKLRAFDITRGEIASATAGSSQIVALAAAGERVISISDEGELCVFSFDGTAFTLLQRRDVFAEAGLEIQRSADVELTLAISPGGESIAVGIRSWESEHGAIWSWRVARGAGSVVAMDGSKPMVLSDSGLLAFRRNGKIIVFDPAASTIAAELGILREGIVDAALLSKGTWIGGITDRGNVYGWPVDALDQAPVRLATPGSFGRERGIIGFANDSFAVYTDDGPFRVISLTDRSNVREFAGSTGVLRRIVLDRVHDRIITAGHDRFVRTWSLESPPPVQIVHTFPNWALDLDILPESNMLVAGGGDDAPLALIDATTFESTELLPSLGKYGSRLVSISPQERYLATTSNLNTAKVFNLQSRQALSTLSGHRGDITAMAFSPDESRLVTASLDGTARVWDSVSGRELARFSLDDAELNGVYWFRSGPRIVATTRTGLLVLWNVDSGKEILSITADTSSIDAFLVLEENDSLVTGSSGGRIRRWKISTFDLLGDLVSAGNAVSSFAMSPDGSRLLSGHRNGELKVWDTRGWREIVTLRGHRSGVRDMKFVQDGAVLVSAGEEGEIRAWQSRHIQEQSRQ